MFAPLGSKANKVCVHAEPNDGGWNVNTNAFKGNKPYLKYSNVFMQGGQSFVGNLIVTATESQFKVREG